PSYGPMGFLGSAPGAVGHVSVPGPAPLIATALFMVGLGSAVGAFFLTVARGPRRAARIGLIVLAAGCLAVATLLPFVIRPGPSFVRPSTRARLEILEPRPGAVLPGDPAR